MKPITVVLVDDHPVVLEGLNAMLSSDAGITVLAQASSGEEGVALTEQLEPDVVLLDVRMPGMSGTQAAREIKERRPKTAVVMLTMYDSQPYVLEAIQAGAAGYLTKDASRELVSRAVRTVVEGGTIVRSGLLRQAIQGLTRMGATDGVGDTQRIFERLTRRELDVAVLLAEGASNTEISDSLGLVEVTVKKYVHMVIQKLGVSDRTNAALLCARLGVDQFRSPRGQPEHTLPLRSVPSGI